MKDGLTRKLNAPRGSRSSGDGFADRFEVHLVVLSGPAAGTTFSMTGERITLGRGPGVDLAFDDSTMSRQHALIEIGDGTLRVRDLGSTNGLQVNDEPVQSTELGHGDRLHFGQLTLQVLIEERAEATETYELPAEA